MPNPKRMLGGSAVATGAGVLSTYPAPAQSKEADPIIAAIDAHRNAEAHFLAVIRAGNDEDGEPEWEAACQACDDAAFALLETEPATIAGLVALLNYSVLFVNSGNVWPNPRDYEWDGPRVHDLCAGFETALLARTVDLLRTKFAKV